MRKLHWENIFESFQSPEVSLSQCDQVSKDPQAFGDTVDFCGQSLDVVNQSDRVVV